MSVENGVIEAAVRIRTPRLDWMPMLVGGLVFLAMRALELMVPVGSPGGSWLTGYNGLLVIGGVFVLESLWIRSFGVDLTPEFANVRGLLRRHVRWDQVQAVQCFSRLGSDRVCLVLENGQVVNLRAPTISWGFGAARYEHDFHRIGQWWLAHRGPSWRPIGPEAPGAPAPE
jgi:hypothetical protein